MWPDSQKLIPTSLIIPKLYWTLERASASEKRSVRRAALEASLRDVLFQIIKFVNEKKDHVPSFSEGVIYFPYEITIPRSALF
ncbi:hypothetical protein WN944_021181 [Citrus x changshan-huyou]|uniref:Autophagy-related protein 101 n=1 Tax=Citrus x changshan-huyou TaxID=2935761 RepID=A0AAP0MZ51_9ROSI